jgi:hypothetical protein
MIRSSFFLVANIYVLLAIPYFAHAALVKPNPSTLNIVKTKRVLIIDDKFWNIWHEVPKEETLKRLKSINTAIGFALFTVRDTAKNITLEELNNYDIVIFNYCDNLKNARGTLFETALKKWFAKGNKGYMGYHTSGFHFTPPAEGEEWTWYNDSVTSLRFISRSSPHTNGKLIMTQHDSLKKSPILDGLDASFSASDVWLSMETESPNAAPTWHDCKVLYTYSGDNMPQIWIREDDLGNRYFYSMQFHDSHKKGVASDFWYNMLLRALEYVAGDRQAFNLVNKKTIHTTRGLSYVTKNRQLMVDLDGSYQVSLLTPTGKHLYSTKGEGTMTSALPLFIKVGFYIVRFEFNGKQTYKRILFY